MSGNAREPGRSTLDRVMTLLDVFDGTDLCLADIVDRSGLPITTAHRMLGALEHWGGVERTECGEYRIGTHLWQLGNLAAMPASLRETAQPLMQDLYELTHENVQLATRQGHQALVVERITGARAVPTVTRVGGLLPLHATGVGKLLLAHSSASLLMHLQHQGKLRRYTPYTLTMPGRLTASLTTARAAGVATAQEEMTLGTSSIAAPVTDATDTVQAALSVVVHATTDLTQYTAALKGAARELSRRLKYQEITVRAMRRPQRSGENLPVPAARDTTSISELDKSTG